MRHARKRALTFPTLQTIVSYTRLKCNSPDGGQICRATRPGPPSSAPPIRRIKNREVDHLRKFIAAMRRAMPGRDDVDLYWGLNFALAMSHHTIREKERLTKLSEGQCDLNDVAGIIDRVVSVSVMALAAGETPAKKTPSKVAAR